MEYQIAKQHFPIMGNSTLFIVPFHYGEENEHQVELTKNFVVDESDTSLWTLETKMLTDEGDGSVIYPYIMSFLQGQMMDEECKTDGHLVIYSIADIDRRKEQTTKFEQRKIIRKFWNKFVQSTHTIDVGTKNNPYLLSFKFNNGKHNTLKPHLFIFPSARIGLLSFGIELNMPNATTNDLKLLNYSLHKLSKPVARCVCTSLNICGQQDSDIRKHKEEYFNNARLFLAEHKDNKKERATEGDEVVEFSWNMKNLIDTMLKDFHGIVNSSTNVEEHRSYDLFTPPRIHLFTFCGIDDSQDNILTKEDILPELYSLSRCVNDKYLLPFEEISFKEGYLQTFENVYVSSTIEGTSFIALSKEQNSKFFEGFTGILALRYVWIYLLAVIQRYSLLNMDRMLTVLEAKDAKIKKDSKDKRTKRDTDKVKKHSAMLWRLLETIRNVKVRCHFTDISPFTQHNEFYDHCCDKLHVSSAFIEIDHKTKALNLTMGHDLQVLKEAREDRLNLFLAIFAVLQGISVFAELINALFKGDYYIALLYFALILISVVIVAYVYKDKKNYN